MSARLLFLSSCLALAAPSVARAQEPSADAPHIVPGERSGRLHLRIDANFHYGIGGQSALGPLLHVTGYAAVWDAGGASGSFDVGVLAFYANEPTALAPWLIGSSAEGAGHRTQLLATAGHTFHLLEGRELALGIHVFAGWNMWISEYAIEYANEGVSGSSRITRHHFVTGAELALAYRIAPNVGLNLALGGPFPHESSYVVGMFFVSVGLSFFIV